MARLRKKDRWLEQAQAMIEGVSLSKAAERCGVHPTTAYRWRHRFLSAPALDKPQMLQRDCGSRRNLYSRIVQGPGWSWSDVREPRKRGGKARHPGAFFENIPVLVARDCSAAMTDAVLPEDTAVCIKPEALAGRRPPSCKPARLRWRPAGAFLSPDCAKIPGARGSRAGKAWLPGESGYHINNVNAYHSRLKEWLRRFHGVSTKNLPNYLGWRRALEAWGDQATPQNWIWRHRDGALSTDNVIRAMNFLRNTWRSFASFLVSRRP